MAIKKTIKTKCGIEGNYIKVVNYTNTSCSILVWLNKEAKDSGYEHLPYSMSYGIPEELLSEDNIKQAGKSQLVLIYEFLKTIPEFDGAEDA